MTATEITSSANGHPEAEIIGTTKQYAGEPPVNEELIAVTSLGEGLRLVSERKLTLTVETSEKHLSLPKVPGERDLRNQHVDYLVRCWRRGTFRPELVTLASCQCLADGQEYRINGQHTCWTRILLAEEVTSPDIKFLRYEGKTLEDVKQIYTAFDRGTPRTRANVIEARLRGTPLAEGLSKSLLGRLQAGMGFWLWEDHHHRKHHDGDDVAYLMETEHATIVTTVSGFLRTIKDFDHLKHINRSPVIAAMFATFAKAVAKSKDFWEAVSTGTGMTNVNDPRLKLRNFLMNAKLSSANATTKGCTTTSEGMFRACIFAWNAFRKEEDLQVLRVHVNGKRPALK